jgi:hypothetical protein
MVMSCANCRLTMDEGNARWKCEGGVDSLVEIIAEHLDDDGSR